MTNSIDVGTSTEPSMNRAMITGAMIEPSMTGCETDWFTRNDDGS